MATEKEAEIMAAEEARIGYGTLSRKVDSLTAAVQQLTQRVDTYWSGQVSLNC